MTANCSFIQLLLFFLCSSIAKKKNQWNEERKIKVCAHEIKCTHALHVQSLFHSLRRRGCVVHFFFFSLDGNEQNKIKRNIKKKKKKAIKNHSKAKHWSHTVAPTVFKTFLNGKRTCQTVFNTLMDISHLVNNEFFILCIWRNCAEWWWSLRA